MKLTFCPLFPGFPPFIHNLTLIIYNRRRIIYKKGFSPRIVYNRVFFLRTSWVDRSPECTRPSFPQHVSYSSPPASPPAAAASIATPTSGILPCPGHDATYVPCTHDHAHTGASARPRHDEFCRTAIPSTKCPKCADDAAASSTGDAHDGTLLCSQPTTLLCPQPAAAGILLTSRGGQ